MSSRINFALTNSLLGGLGKEETCAHQWKYISTKRRMQHYVPRIYSALYNEENLIPLASGYGDLDLSLLFLGTGRNLANSAAQWQYILVCIS